MNADRLARIAQAAQADLQRVGDAALEEYLQPIQARAFVVKVREMSDMDHRAVELAKGKAEHARMMQEAERMEAQYGNVDRTR